MKTIIPFKKDVIFKTNLSEITSISLEHTLTIKDDFVQGEFIINGEYKVSDKSTSVEPFNLNLPFSIAIDEKYDTQKATIDIDDFYYEIINNNVLNISIDVLVDKLQEHQLIDIEPPVDVTPVRDIIEAEEVREKEEDSIRASVETKKEDSIKASVEEEKRCIDESEKEDYNKKREDDSMNDVKDRDGVEQVEEKINSLFNQFSKDSEVYVTYNVFILRDGDSIDSIMEKYNISLDELKKYNDLSNLKIGDKIIIPNTYERD